MMLLQHEGILIPLPPKWYLESKNPSGVTVAKGPALTEKFPNIVVSSGINLRFETAEALARRVLDSLQYTLKNFQLLQQVSVAHAYLSVYSLSYELSVGRDETSLQRLRQSQYYVPVDEKIYTITIGHIKERFGDVEGFGPVMIARLRIT